MVCFLASCSTTTWWPGIDSQKKCSDNKWKPDGHINTTHIVSNIAGVASLSAERYALYSQVPDAQWFRFSAPAVSVWATLLPWEWDYRYEINAILHSLHGGDYQQIQFRRKILETLIQEYRVLGLLENDWKVGFLIHALGDSYAHVYKKSPSSAEKAYGPAIGHLFKKGIYSPDSIKKNLKNYLLYVNALYRALNTGAGSTLALNEYIEFVRNLAGNNEDEYIALNLASYNENSAPPTNYCEHINWSNTVTKKEVSLFLKSIKNRLNKNI
jgi:hypothetical protein